MDNVGKVVILKHHVCCVFCYVCTRDAHCDTDVGTRQSGGVIDTISGHGNNFPLVLEG